MYLNINTRSMYIYKSDKCVISSLISLNIRNIHQKSAALTQIPILITRGFKGNYCLVLQFIGNNQRNLSYMR